MNEDEIIQIVKDYINYIRFDEKPKYSASQWQMAIEDLLDLYQQEKNKEYTIHLTDEQYRKAIDAAQKDTDNKWQDKIKAKIKNLEQTRQKHMEYSYEIFYAIDRLNELLKMEK